MSSEQTTKTSSHSKFIIETDTTVLQYETEEECRPYFVNISKLPKNQLTHLREIGFLSSDEDDERFDLRLLRDKHTDYCTQGLTQPLPPSYVSLDASHGWMIYWLLHSLDLLDSLPPSDVLCRIVSTLHKSWTQTEEEGGGFGGGPHQIPHCAPTYAAVMSLVIIASMEKECEAKREALRRLQAYRLPLQQWFGTLYDPMTGGYRMHRDGEVDVRATYTIVSASALLNILPSHDLYTPYVRSCQTYEGGFGGEPFNEAHGGYTYCALASLAILNTLECIHVKKCRAWLAFRQMAFEGGFSGRTNKLVDGCYSFWQGASFVILDLYERKGRGMGVQSQPQRIVKVTTMDQCDPQHQKNNRSSFSFDPAYLQRYILLCAQHADGGLRDKPSKSRDFYHTCYNLSGLSVAQFLHASDKEVVVYGHSSNVLGRAHPYFNIRVERVYKVLEYFYYGEERKKAFGLYCV